LAITTGLLRTIYRRYIPILSMRGSQIVSTLLCTAKLVLSVVQGKLPMCIFTVSVVCFIVSVYVYSVSVFKILLVNVACYK